MNTAPALPEIIYSVSTVAPGRDSVLRYGKVIVDAAAGRVLITNRSGDETSLVVDADAVGGLIYALQLAQDALRTGKLQGTR